jgi:hypothetical protein
MKWGATPFCFFSSDSASLDLSMSRKENAHSGRLTGYPEVMPRNKLSTTRAISRLRGS